MKPKKSLQIFKNFLTRLGRIYKNNRNYNTGIRCMQEQKWCHYPITSYLYKTPKNV